MMIVDNKYQLGDIVYLTTDPEQSGRIVVEIVVTKGDVMYRVSLGTTTTIHYEFELSSEVNTLAKI